MARRIAWAIGIILGLSSCAQQINSQVLRLGVGASVLPPGVTLQSPDGGVSYYANNGFTNATASVTFGGTTYANGWDSPSFFPVGPWESSYEDQPGLNTYVAIGLNTAFIYTNPHAGQLDLMKNNGISVIPGYQFLGQIFGNDRTLGSESVGILNWDEPQTVLQAIEVQAQGKAQANFTGTIGGASNQTLTVDVGVTGPVFAAVSNGYSTPAVTGLGVSPGSLVVGYGTGTGGAGTYIICAYTGYSCGSTNAVGDEALIQPMVSALTSTLQNKRFFWENNTNNFIAFKNLGTATASQLLSTQYTTPDGSSRHIDLQSIDLYFFIESYDPSITFQQQMSNVYDTSFSSPAMTTAQGAKGSHYGDMIDIERSFQTTFPAPILTFIDAGNGNTGIKYISQPVEINWATWSFIIHGGRGVAYFQTDSLPVPYTPGTCALGNFLCSYYQTAQAATFSGSISGTTLTVTTTPTGSTILAPGMVATSGVSGASTILQQTFPASADAGGIGTYTISGGTGSGTLTYTQPASMTSAVASNLAVIKAIGPVINSQFANGYVTVSPNGYNHDGGLTQSCGALQSFACGTNTGIEVMAKYYTGGTYTTSGPLLNNTDTITNGFYIFADTRNAETTLNSSATFTVAGHVSSVTVINEGRSITPSSGTTFSDTFANAWTTHIYKIIQ